ncbi:toxin glutamine deamidase domain-containing protein [Streptomyces sp. enrichment culture]|uniref:toxin glutamine deamidase domain-containing protein n=1 Tax=Streptomyces sp. enrichment culture TaxID=1795815 RepID=UPI003F54328B
MMLPDELEWVLQMLGYNWPTADEDKLRESAQLWRTFGDDVTGLHTAANASARTVVAHNAGESIDAFTKAYAKFDGGSGGSDGYLADAAQAAYIIANVLESCAYLVEFAKWAVIAQLIALAIEIAAAQVAAPFTFGLSEVAALGATQATRLIVRRLLDELKQALMEAVVEALKEPAISAVEAMITDLVRQSVNVGFGAQQGFDLSQTASAGVQGGWEAIKQTPQTLAEGVRDSLGQKAGNRFHHAIDSRIDGYGGTPGTPEVPGADGGDGGSDGDSGSGATRSNPGSVPRGSDSPSSSTTRSDAGSGPGADIGGGISADTSGSRVGVPDMGTGPDPEPGSGSGQGPSSSDVSYPRPTTSHSGPSLSDFDDPTPGGTSSNASDNSSSSGAPGSAGPSPSGGGSPVSGLSSPTPHSAPTPTSSSGMSSPPGGSAISTSIDSLAAGIPAQPNTAPAPATTDTSSSGGSGRTDGGSTMPSSPTPPSHAGGTTGTRPGTLTSGGTPSTTSPTPNSGPARNSSATAPGAPSAATGTGPASTPNPTSPTTPRTAPTPDSRIPAQRTPGNAPDGNTTPRSTPDAAGGPRTHSPNTNPAPGTAPAPSQHPTQTTPHQNPAQASPSRSAGIPTTTPPTSTGAGSDRASVPNSRTANSSPQSGPTPQSTPSGQHQPGTGPARPPQRPATNTPNTPSTPQQPAAHPHTPQQNAPHTQQQVTAVPLYTITPTPGPAASPSHSAPATPQPPGSPATTPSPQQPQQDSLETIRADLNHSPGGLTPPDPADQQALADAVPHTEDGTPQRFPDPFGPWTQLQNDGGNTVPGRSNNCADCSRSFLETWYGNPQVSAPRTIDLDEHGNPDPWSPEHNANANQIRWTGAAHTYAGPGGDPDTAHTIASTLQQAGHGAAAIVQVDWPGGGGHAFNAVNHHGTIIWIDTQSGDVSHTPLHLDQAAHVWHIPLDADQRPIDTTQPRAKNDGQPENNQNPQNDSGSPSEPDSAPNGREPSPDTPSPSDQRSRLDGATRLDEQGRTSGKGSGQPTATTQTPARPESPGSAKDNADGQDDNPYTVPHDRGESDTSDESRRVTKNGPDSDVSRTHADPEGTGSREYGIEPDQLQSDLRMQRDVHRVELDRIHDRLQQWAESGELTRVLRATSKDGPHPDPDGPYSFTRAQLSQHLEGFDRLSQGEQQAVVASLARLSFSFHKEHSVGANPERVNRPYRGEGEGDPAPKTPDRGAKLSRESLGVRLHRMAVNQLFKRAFFKKLPSDEAGKVRRSGPDFSGKNFAVLEVQGPPPDHEVTYAVDSSVPANQKLPGVQPRHSERHLLDWLKRVDPEGAKYTPLGLYTEREPCGQGEGHMKCSTVLLDERFNDVPIHYSTTYRDDPAGVAIRKKMLSERDKTLEKLKGMSDDEIKEHMTEKWSERYKSDGERLARALDRLEGKSGAQLIKSITKELDAQRKETRTLKEQAIAAEFDRHIIALKKTWDAILPALMK